MRALVGFLGPRLFRALVALWLVSTVVFVVMRLSGDPVPLLLPPDAPTSEILRVRREPAGEAPGWPARLLARLGELVFERAKPFWPGGRIELGDGGDEMPPAVCWTPDPELGEINTPNGNLEFVATVGVGLDLLARLRAEGTEAGLAGIRTVNPLLVTGAAGLGW